MVPQLDAARFDPADERLVGFFLRKVRVLIVELAGKCAELAGLMRAGCVGKLCDLALGGRDVDRCAVVGSFRQKSLLVQVRPRDKTGRPAGPPDSVTANSHSVLQSVAQRSRMMLALLKNGTQILLVALRKRLRPLDADRTVAPH